MATLPELLHTLVGLEGSDLHITTDTPPQVRVHGHLRRLDGPDMTPGATKQLTYSVLTDAQKKRFEETLELDFSFGIKGLARFRCNMFNQRGAVGAVYRLIPEKIRSFQELGLPAVLATLAERPRGLVLVTGPTGSGKSTTLAAMLDKINKERHDHILTIEDPIEFVHQHQGCLVNQREVHSDTQSFSMALRAALREDPDIVLIGEMRDLETVEAALKIAETGHLTFGTLHTNSAAQTINRIIDIFPANQQSQIRTQLSLVLEGIVCQALLPKTSGGRCRGARDPGADAGYPQPDSRGQGPPDLLLDADRSGEVRDADDEPVAGDAASAEAGHARYCDDRLVEPRRAAGNDQSRRGRRCRSRSGPPGPAAATGGGTVERTTNGYFCIQRADQGGTERHRRAHGGDDGRGGRRAAARPDPRHPDQSGRARRPAKTPRAKAVKPKSLAMFTRQFSVMIDAGLPLVQCLEILGTQEEDKGFAQTHSRDARRRRERRLAGRRHAEAPEDVRSAVHQHDRGR